MSDLRGQQLKDSYQNLVTRGTGNKLENGNGVEFADLDDKASLSGANFTDMPQVDGIPIVESGSNSDGEFVRFADGTQICSNHFLNSGGSRLTGTWSYPQPFHLSSINRRTANREIFKMASGSIEYNGDGDAEGIANNFELESFSMSATTSPEDEQVSYRLRWSSSIASGRSADATITANGRWK